MIDREKVIKGLECCADPRGKCPECPYNMEDTDVSYYCTTMLSKDALALLKAQEPRMLTLEELEDWRNAIWFEEKGEYPFLALIRSYYKDDELSIIDAHCYGKITNHDMRLYNKWWRCWTSRPTDEQREAVKWDV